jgi:hypothetical protein
MYRPINVTVMIVLITIPIGFTEIRGILIIKYRNWICLTHTVSHTHTAHTRHTHTHCRLKTRNRINLCPSASDGCTLHSFIQTNNGALQIVIERVLLVLEAEKAKLCGFLIGSFRLRVCCLNNI